MSAIDWLGLVRLGLRELRLEPAAFWRLTPVELKLMLGAEAANLPLTRARLYEMSKAFPDTTQENAHGADRRPARAGGGSGSDLGCIERDGVGL